MRNVVPVFLMLAASCSKPVADGAPTPAATAVASAPSSAAPSSAAPLEGNALSGMPNSSELLPLAKPDAKCRSCVFNGRCALLTDGRAAPDAPCCDYADGKKADAWKASSGTGHAAECLATVLDAPYAPAKAKGTLQPLAKPGQACAECFFNGRCALLTDGSVASTTPCCDYSHGKKPGVWADDDGTAARCLAMEAHVTYK